jgi:hypothetical protein
MSSTSTSTTEAQIGHDPDDVEETSEAAVADALGLDITAVDPEAGEERLESMVEDLADDEAVPDLLGDVLSMLVAQNRQLRERVEELEDTQQTVRDVARTAVGSAETNESRLEEIEDDCEETREISRCAIAKAEQLDAAIHDEGTQEDVETLPDGIEPSTSPLDFFANCRQQKVKEIFVEESNRSNTYRAIAIAKRWDEFAHVDDHRIVWTRDDVETALTAHLGESPHRQTVSRVTDKLVELGGSDVEEKTRKVGRSQDPKQIVVMDVETAHGLQENRYLGLDLLDGSERKATSGGVTPVVTGRSG